jgi:hypothetical protein
LAAELLFDADTENAASRLRHAPTWQQKRVSIKTLEGEFSVTMWASGGDDGRNLKKNFLLKNILVDLLL